MCVAAHPHAPYPSGTFTFPFQGLDVVEVWNGLWSSDRPWNPDNEAAPAEWGRTLAAGIATGSWRPAMGSGDTHLEGQIGIPHTVVFAEELSTQAILAALGSGRSWIAESANVEVAFTVSAQGRVVGVGERITTHGGQVEVQATVQGGAVGGRQLPHRSRQSPPRRSSQRRGRRGAVAHDGGGVGLRPHRGPPSQRAHRRTHQSDHPGLIAGFNFHRWLDDVMDRAAGRTEHCPEPGAHKPHPSAGAPRDDTATVDAVMRRPGLDEICEELYRLMQIRPDAGYAPGDVEAATQRTRQIIAETGVTEEQFNEYVRAPSSAAGRGLWRPPLISWPDIKGRRP
jgi:hypothetical protein